jgi:hypothetical protein
MRLSGILKVLLPCAALVASSAAYAGGSGVITGTFTATDEKNSDNSAEAVIQDNALGENNEVTVDCTCDDGTDLIEWNFNTDLIDQSSLKESSAKIGQEQKSNPATLTVTPNGGQAVVASCEEVKVSASGKEKGGTPELSWKASAKNCDAGTIVSGLVDAVCKNNVEKNGAKAKADGNMLKSVSCKGKGETQAP